MGMASNVGVSARRQRTPAGVVWVGLVIAIALIWLTNLHGWWFVTPAVGLLVGLFFRGGSVVTVLAGVSGLAGWILPLLLPWHRLVGATASTVSGIMGFGTENGWIVWVLTGVIGLLLALAGSWLGSSVRRMGTA